VIFHTVANRKCVQPHCFTSEEGARCPTFSWALRSQTLSCLNDEKKVQPKCKSLAQKWSPSGFRRDVLIVSNRVVLASCQAACDPDPGFSGFRLSGSGGSGASSGCSCVGGEQFGKVSACKVQLHFLGFYPSFHSRTAYYWCTISEGLHFCSEASLGGGSVVGSNGVLILQGQMVGGEGICTTGRLRCPLHFGRDGRL
jgi:hypothetical protein